MSAAGGRVLKISTGESLSAAFMGVASPQSIETPAIRKSLPKFATLNIELNELLMTHLLHEVCRF